MLYGALTPQKFEDTIAPLGICETVINPTAPRPGDTNGGLQLAIVLAAHLDLRNGLHVRYSLGQCHERGILSAEYGHEGTQNVGELSGAPRYAGSFAPSRNTRREACPGFSHTWTIIAGRSLPENVSPAFGT